MLEPRYYQREGLDRLYEYWADGGGNGLIVHPTGSGKAFFIAKLIEELLAQYPDLRIINVTHSANLVGQNFKEFIGLSPFAPAGIYSAGLGRRDARAQILFAGIQSVAKRVAELGDTDLVIVDEAHAISRNANTQYGKFFRDLRKLNPNMRVVGLTATDYRMDSGRLTEGDDEDEMVATNEAGETVTVRPQSLKLFDDVVHEVGIGELMDAGFLTHLTSSKTTAKINLKGVGTRGGEYIPGQLSDAAEEIIEQAVAEDMVISEGRRAGLFFSTSKDNARHIRDVIRRHGRTCEALTSDNAHEQTRIFEDFKAGRLWAISSVSMITTGTNFPFVDFISLILSTKSPGKLVQILGRGTRNCDGKTDCLIADHGKNLAYHGPIDQISPKIPGSGDGEQPRKRCPDGSEASDKPDENGNTGCGELIPISVMKCHCCGYIFPPNEEEKITARPDDAPVLSTEKPWSVVTGRRFFHHPGKSADKKDTVKVAYIAGFKSINQWLCPAHPAGGFAKSQADRYWRAHLGKSPCPASVLEWLERASELKPTVEIQLDYSRNHKYPDVKQFRVAANANVMPAEQVRKAMGAAHAGIAAGRVGALAAVMDDEVPY